ncbi:hypothetical protein KY385_04715 [Candidatus Parcubacteria bacterium]|nr:hypothetical protein [Candidatus Parcubacteria bacterium]
MHEQEPKPRITFAINSPKVLGTQAMQAMKNRDWLIGRGSFDSQDDIAQAHANMNGALDVYPDGRTKRPDLTETSKWLKGWKPEAVPARASSNPKS